MFAKSFEADFHTEGSINNSNLNELDLPSIKHPEDKIENEMHKIDMVFGYIQSLCTFGLIIYIGLSIVLKTRYSCVQWSILGSLLCTSVLLMCKFFDFSNVCVYQNHHYPYKEACILKNRIVFALACIILNMASITAVYGIYLKTNEIYNFAKYGSLPEKSKVRMKNIMYWVVWAMNVVDGAFVVVLNTIWLYYRPENDDSLDNFMIVNKCIKIIFLAIISAIAVASMLLLRKTEKIVTPASFTTGMIKRIYVLVLCLAIFYAFDCISDIAGLAKFNKMDHTPAVPYTFENLFDVVI